MSTRRTSASSRPTTTRWPTPRCSPATSTITRRRRGAAWRRACRWPHTTRCSSARTPSTCSTLGGAIAVTDRAAYILRVRALSQAVARAHLDQQAAVGRAMPDLLIEIGCEELPAWACARPRRSCPRWSSAGSRRPGWRPARDRAFMSARAGWPRSCSACRRSGRRCGARCAAPGPTHPSRRGPASPASTGSRPTRWKSATASCGRWSRAGHAAGELVPRRSCGSIARPPVLQDDALGRRPLLPPDPLAGGQDRRRRGAHARPPA